MADERGHLYATAGREAEWFNPAMVDRAERGRAPILLALAAAILVCACGPAGGATLDPAQTGTGVPMPFRTLPVTTVLIGELELTLAVADSPAQRTRGLAGVRDLGPLDGMLFTFPDAVDTAFTMRGTDIPLDIAFIDGTGQVLSVTRMDPCDAEPCPAYAAPGPYRWAIETPAGGLAEVAIGDAFAVQP
jgi:uncharacterized membrane protein (UPF0127 family)